MKKIAEGEPQTAIMATLGTEFYTKHVIVVDDDVDIFDTNDVMWAVATRVLPDKDIFLIPGVKGAIIDKDCRVGRNIQGVFTFTTDWRR